MNIWIVIPAHNEEKSIRRIVNDVFKLNRNIIIVDDHSTDQTGHILETLPVNRITNNFVLGYTGSLQKGIEKAFAKNADYVITFDADGQHDAGDIKKFKEVIEKCKPDIVIGKRSKKNRLAETIIGFVTHKLVGISDPFCGMKAYSRSIFEKYHNLEDCFTIGTQLAFRAIKNGATYKEIPITVHKRPDQSRFATSVRGNLLELNAIINVAKYIV